MSEIQYPKHKPLTINDNQGPEKNYTVYPYFGSLTLSGLPSSANRRRGGLGGFLASLREQSVNNIVDLVGLTLSFQHSGCQITALR